MKPQLKKLAVAVRGVLRAAGDQKARFAHVSAALLLGVAASPVSAQVTDTTCTAADPVFLAEGPVSSVSHDGAGGGTITAMGVNILVPASAPVTTPTATLDMATFADPTSFPGRSQQGYVGATVIANGCVKFDAGLPVAVASDVFSDVAENVMLGVITAPLDTTDTTPPAPVTVGTLGVDGTTVSLLQDPRMPAHPISNAFGFPITAASVAVGANVAVEGYYANDGSGVLHAWAVEVDGGTPVDQVNPQISIQRFRCAGDIEMRGGIYLATPTCTFGAPYSLALFDTKNTADPADDTPIPLNGDADVLNGIAPAPDFCSYRLTPAVAACPDAVRLELRNNNVPVATATAP